MKKILIILLRDVKIIKVPMLRKTISNIGTLIFFTSLCTFIVACGVDDTNLKISKNKDAAQALSIARQSGCLNCHNVTNSIVGPAWVLVSERYKLAPDAREMLIEKVKKGGNGSWNNITGGAEMPAHEKRLSHQHIALIVDFILSLKREEH